MLAELLGKLDPDGLGGLERSEDLLTAAVFGAIRHLPAEAVLGRLLTRLGIHATTADLDTADIQLWPTYPRPGWPGHGIEPDVRVLVGKQPIVFEAKLHSGFGPYTRRPDDSTPVHQLAVQYSAVASWAKGEQLLPPVIVALTRGPTSPTSELDTARQDVMDLGRQSPGDPVRWLSWHQLAEVVESTKESLRPHEKRLASDLLALMEKRGVRHMFKGFKAEDYWVVTSAQRIAAERLYPEIRTFFDDFGAVLDEDGVERSQPSWDAMWMGLGTSASRPVDWTRSFIARQYWPKSWPTREKAGANTALYALFDFVDPGFEVGLSIPGPGVAAAQSKWSDHLSELAAAITPLDSSFEFLVDGGDIARPTQVLAPSEVSEDWLQSMLSAMGTTSHLRIRRRSDALNLTVQFAREEFRTLQESVSNSAVRDLLAAAGYTMSTEALTADG